MKKLTAKQIFERDEINIDSNANDETYRRATAFHSNRINELMKLDRGWWDKIIEFHGLDRSKKWKVGFEEGCAVIIEDKK